MTHTRVDYYVIIVWARDGSSAHSVAPNGVTISFSPPGPAKRPGPAPRLQAPAPAQLGLKTCMSLGTEH